MQLGDWGFGVTRRDGRYDVANAGEGLTLGQVYEIYRRLKHWPNWPGPTAGASELPQRLCGGWGERDSCPLLPL